MSDHDALIHLVAALLVRHATVDMGDHSQLTVDALLEEAAGILEAIEVKARQIGAGK